MRLLAVDGNSIVNRAFYGIRPLTTKDGQFTNAIYGFLTMLYKIKNEENPDAVAIAFDLKTPTFRHKAYAGYKATRKGMPEELASQMEPLKKLLTLLGYRLVTCEGFVFLSALMPYFSIKENSSSFAINPAHSSASFISTT